MLIDVEVSIHEIFHEAYDMNGENMPSSLSSSPSSPFSLAAAPNSMSASLLKCWGTELLAWFV